MKNANTVPVISAEEAAKMIQDQDMVAFCGAGGGITEATALLMHWQNGTEIQESRRIYPSGILPV